MFASILKLIHYIVVIFNYDKRFGDYKKNIGK